MSIDPNQGAANTSSISTHSDQTTIDQPSQNSPQISIGGTPMNVTISKKKSGKSNWSKKLASISNSIKTQVNKLGRAPSRIKESWQKGMKKIDSVLHRVAVKVQVKTQSESKHIQSMDTLAKQLFSGHLMGTDPQDLKELKGDITAKFKREFKALSNADDDKKFSAIFDAAYMFEQTVKTAAKGANLPFSQPKMNAALAEMRTDIAASMCAALKVDPADYENWVSKAKPSTRQIADRAVEDVIKTLNPSDYESKSDYATALATGMIDRIRTDMAERGRGDPYGGSYQSIYAHDIEQLAQNFEKRMRDGGPVDWSKNLRGNWFERIVQPKIKREVREIVTDIVAMENQESIFDERDWQVFDKHEPGSPERIKKLDEMIAKMKAEDALEEEERIAERERLRQKFTAMKSEPSPAMDDARNEDVQVGSAPERMIEDDVEPKPSISPDQSVEIASNEPVAAPVKIEPKQAPLAEETRKAVKALVKEAKEALADLADIDENRYERREPEDLKKAALMDDLWRAQAHKADMGSGKGDGGKAYSIDEYGAFRDDMSAQLDALLEDESALKKIDEYVERQVALGNEHGRDFFGDAVKTAIKENVDFLNDYFVWKDFKKDSINPDGDSPGRRFVGALTNHPGPKQT